MLEDEANEDVVERRRVPGQRVQVGVAELDVRQPGRGRAPSGYRKGAARDVDGGESSRRAVSGERDCLRSDAAAHFEDACARRVNGAVVQQAKQGGSLVIQANGFRSRYPWT
jgi:hypothetical protein